jgi:membrane protease YdiL (CAAX protease family)
MAVTAPSPVEPHGVRALLRRHPLTGYFVLTFGFSWLVILALEPTGLPSGVVVTVVTAGPTFGAVVMTALLEGRPGLRALRARIRLWRVGVRWYAVALIGIPVVYVVATLAVPAARASYTPVPVIAAAVQYLVVLVLGGIVGGPLLEEPGWRGFALPRLQERWGPLGGTLVLGILWGAWHLPQYLIPGWAGQNGGLHASSVAVFLLTVVAFTVVMTWVFNGSRGSLLLAMLAHASLNTTQVAVVNRVFPAVADSEVNALLGFGVVALVLVAVTRGRLGSSPHG